MRKFLIIGVCIAGFAFIAADPCPMHHESEGSSGEHHKSEGLKWEKEAKVEIMDIENGAVVKIVSDKPEVVKEIQQWVRELAHKQFISYKEKVTDIGCGMEIEKAKALSAEYEGKTYYFCSQDCKDEFLKDPATYIGEKTQEGR